MTDTAVQGSRRATKMLHGARTSITSLPIYIWLIVRENLLTTLRSMSDDGESSFGVLSSVIAGGYLMMPSVRDHIGYPGHGRHRVDIEKTVDQLTSGILSSVQERGHTFRRPPEEDT